MSQERIFHQKLKAVRVRITNREPTATTGVPGWDAALPWIRAGTTRRERSRPRARETRGRAAAGVGRGAAGGASDGWRAPFGDAWRSVVRSRQVHGAATKVHSELPPGESVAGEGDGHVTRLPGLLLTVTLADCTPVFVADPVQRAVAILHAGWRGTAAGVLEQGLAAMRRAFASVPGDLHVHLGPAICGDCYEVGPEVFEALSATVPPGPALLDLRAVLARRAQAAGVAADRLTVSDECTLCGDGRYFSHRRGDAGRHRGFIGILPGPDDGRRAGR